MKLFGHTTKFRQSVQQKQVPNYRQKLRNLFIHLDEFRDTSERKPYITICLVRIV